jgi:hypothetical protein
MGEIRAWKLISQPRHIFAHFGPEFAEAEIWVVEKSHYERLQAGLEEINNHFDDQGFGAHSDRDCADAIVNYAGAVLNGYEGSLAEWWKERA